MLSIVLALLLLATPAWAVTQWSLTLPVVSDSKSAWPAAVHSQWTIMDTLLSNYRRGMVVAYSSASTLTVSAGECTVSNSGGSTRLFLQNAANANITSANLDTGASFSNSTTYYVYAGTSSATAASATYYISLSSSAPTGVTYYLQLGNFTTDGSGNILSPAISIGSAVGFQVPASKSIGTTYLAATDGIVNASCRSDGGGNPTMAGYTDANTPPTTQLCDSRSTNVSGTTGTNCTFPVRKGNYYLVSVANCSTSQIMYFTGQGT